MRWQRNPAYREARRWDLSPRARLALHVACVAFLAFLVLTQRWVAMIVFIVVWAAASVLDAVWT